MGVPLSWGRGCWSGWGLDPNRSSSSIQSSVFGASSTRRRPPAEEAGGRLAIQAAKRLARPVASAWPPGLCLGLLAVLERLLCLNHPLHQNPTQ
jgi:hypothetical protein